MFGHILYTIVIYIYTIVLYKIFIFILLFLYYIHIIQIIFFPPTANEICMNFLEPPRQRFRSWFSYDQGGRESDIGKRWQTKEEKRANGQTSNNKKKTSLEIFLYIEHPVVSRKSCK